MRDRRLVTADAGGVRRGAEIVDVVITPASIVFGDKTLYSHGMLDFFYTWLRESLGSLGTTIQNPSPLGLERREKVEH